MFEGTMTTGKRTDSIVTSYRAIEELLRSGVSNCVLHVAHETGRTAVLVELARSTGVPVRSVSVSSLRAIAGPDARECALEIPTGPEKANATLESVVARIAERQALVLLLDHITDPQNYGAILRSADQFAVDAVLVPTRGSAPVTATVVQASAGVAGYVPVVRVANLRTSAEYLKKNGFWIYAADSSGDPLGKVRLEGKVALVLGSEGKGMSRLLGERSDARIAIPMRGHADSLNVSVACGILLYEVRRQQGLL
jgi:23S rRNA (guanosine2251-2'-O)-methyltransferase